MQPKGYTSVEAIQNYMLTSIDDAFVSQIEAWMMTVEAYIDHETNRDFSLSDETSTDRVYDGDGSTTLDIDPATEITAVKLSPTGTALPTTNYFLYPANQAFKNRIQLNCICFPIGNQNIVVTAKFGYAAIPADIRFAATVLMAGIINNATPTQGEVQSVSIGRYSVTYKTPQQLEDFNKVEDLLQYNKRYSF